MPRITRAALRSNAILEDESVLAMSTPLPATPQKEREPLGEVAGNVPEEPLVIDDVVKAEKKVGAKGRKAKGTKKGKKQPKMENDKTTPEVIDDDNHSATSSAVEEACEDLMKPNTGETYQIPMQDRPTTPRSPAVDVARKLMSPPTNTPHFDPEIRGSEDLRMKAPTNDQEDSFVGTIGSRTPVKITRTETFGSERNEDNTDNHSEDSFVEKIVARSPAKSITRIEDFVDAIDALEDAIEEIGETLPAVSVDAQSPAMDKKATKIVFGPTKATTPKSALKENKIALVKSAPKENTIASPKPALMENKTALVKAPPKENTIASPMPALIENKIALVKSALKENKMASPKPALKENKIASPKPAMKKVSAGRPSTAKATPLPSKALAVRPSATKPSSAPPPAKKTPARPSHISSTRASLAAKPARQPSTTTAAAPNPSTTNPPSTSKRPVSSTHKPPFIPSKSLKPPTRPSFSLPGDAISLKLKEQRAARLAADEAATAAKRAFKARPVRLSAAPVVKPTAASRARLSLALAHEAGGAGAGAGERGVRIKPLPRGSSLSTTENKRVSSLTVAKRDSAVSGATGTIRRAGSAAQQKVSGKEVFRRERVELEERERVRRGKEEGARRAREEAAERGRMASRVWAERERVRKSKMEGTMEGVVGVVGVVVGG